MAWKWFGRGRGLIGKGLNSRGLTRRFATPLRFYYYYIFIIDNLVLQNGFSEIITIVKLRLITYLHEFTRRLIYTNISKYTFVYGYTKAIIAIILKYISIMSCSSTLYAVSLFLVF